MRNDQQCSRIVPPLAGVTDESSCSWLPRCRSRYPVASRDNLVENETLSGRSAALQPPSPPQSISVVTVSDRHHARHLDSAAVRRHSDIQTHRDDDSVSRSLLNDDVADRLAGAELAVRSARTVRLRPLRPRRRVRGHPVDDAAFDPRRLDSVDVTVERLVERVDGRGTFVPRVFAVVPRRGRVNRSVERAFDVPAVRDRFASAVSTANAPVDAPESLPASDSFDIFENLILFSVLNSSYRI